MQSIISLLQKNLIFCFGLDELVLISYIHFRNKMIPKIQISDSPQDESELDELVKINLENVISITEFDCYFAPKPWKNSSGEYDLKIFAGFLLAVIDFFDKNPATSIIEFNSAIRETFCNAHALELILVIFLQILLAF